MNIAQKTGQHPDQNPVAALVRIAIKAAALQAKLDPERDMDPSRIRPFDAADLIETPRDARLFLKEIRASGDLDELRAALMVVSWARRRMRRGVGRGR